MGSSTLGRPGQNVAAVRHVEMLERRVAIPTGSAKPGSRLLQDDTAGPEAALPVPGGHGIGATEEAYVPVCATKLLMATSLVSPSTPAAPGQYVFDSVLLLHSVKLATAVVELPRASTSAKFGAIEEHAATLEPEAALVVPTGHVSTTALALNTPMDAVKGAANVVLLFSRTEEKAPSSPGQ